MAIFLRQGSVAVCDRCGRKALHDVLVPDGDKPGLRVHPHCRDDIDPYRLAMKPVERVSLQHPRPDTPLDNPVDTVGTQDGPGFTIATEDGQRIKFTE